MQRSIRFPDDLDAKVQALAKADDRSFSYVVLRTLESALATDGGGGSPGVSKPVVPASSRASADIPGVTRASRLPKVAETWRR